MEGDLGVLGISSGGSASTVSKEDNVGLSSEESSSYPNEESSELELGLGLSLCGGGGGLKAKQAVASDGGGGGGTWGQYGRILTAKDFPCNKSQSSLSSSSSSSSMTKVSFPTGTKRTADSRYISVLLLLMGFRYILVIAVLFLFSPFYGFVLYSGVVLLP